MMLTLLCSAKTWFMDATFRLIREPFVQLFTIHAFVRQGNSLKQLPLAYVLMSGKSQRDHSAVLTALMDQLRGSNVDSPEIRDAKCPCSRVFFPLDPISVEEDPRTWTEHHVQGKEESVRTTGPLRELMDYVNRTWIESSIWSIVMEHIRQEHQDQQRRGRMA